MRAGEPTEIPNPFAFDPGDKRRPARRAMVSALKLFALVAVALAATVVISSQSQRWLVSQLTSDFDALSSPEKQTRLLELAELGALAIEPLVTSLADEDTEVARTAYDLLRRSQNDWTVLPRDDAHQRHLAMITAMNSIAVQMPDDRTGWAAGLLQQTIVETVDDRDESSRQLYRKATDALARVSLSERAGPSILTDQPTESDGPIRLTVRPQPLPVAAAETGEAWTDWPPPRAAPQDGDVSTTDPSGVSGIRTAVSSKPTAPSAAEAPSVYRSSSMRLQPVGPNDAVTLRDMDAPQETSYQSAQIQRASHLVDSPLETYDTKSVVFWLGNPHPVLRKKAEQELVRRGLSQAQIAIATQIASGDVQTRLALVDSIARSSSIDPRPWLWMLLDDQNRDVKLRVVSVLATMNDPSIRDQLRMRLSDQRDPTVAARIRRVLDLR